MALRDAVGALSSDAIAKIVGAWRDAELAEPSYDYDVRLETAAQAFREALAAVLPQEAGAPPRAGCVHPHGYNAAGLCFDCLAKIAPSISEYGASRAPSEAAPREPSEAAIAAAARTDSCGDRDCAACMRATLKAAYAIDGLSGYPAFQEAPPHFTSGDLVTVANVIAARDEYATVEDCARAALAYAIRDGLVGAASRPEGDGAGEI